MATLSDSKILTKLRKTCLDNADGISGGLDLPELKAVARALGLSDKGTRANLRRVLCNDLYPDAVKKQPMQTNEPQSWEDWLNEQDLKQAKQAKQAKQTKQTKQPKQKSETKLSATAASFQPITSEWTQVKVKSPKSSKPSKPSKPSMKKQVAEPAASLIAVKPGNASAKQHFAHVKGLTAELTAQIKDMQANGSLSNDNAFTTVFKYRFPKSKMAKAVLPSDEQPRYYPFNQTTGASPVVSLVRGYAVVPNTNQVKIYRSSVMQSLSKAFPEYQFAEIYVAGGKPVTDKATKKRLGYTIGHNEIVIVGNSDKWLKYTERDQTRKLDRDTDKEMAKTYVYKPKKRGQVLNEAPAQLPAEIDLASLEQFPSL